MPSDRRARGGQEPDRLDHLLPAGDRAMKDPMPLVDGLEVAVLDPSPGLLGVLRLGPLPQRTKDRVVGSCEGPLARNMPVIDPPGPDDRVEVQDQEAGAGGAA